MRRTPAPLAPPAPPVIKKPVPTTSAMRAAAKAQARPGLLQQHNPQPRVERQALPAAQPGTQSTPASHKSQARPLARHEAPAVQVAPPKKFAPTTGAMRVAAKSQSRPGWLEQRKSISQPAVSVPTAPQAKPAAQPSAAQQRLLAHGAKRKIT